MRYEVYEEEYAHVQDVRDGLEDDYRVESEREGREEVVVEERAVRAVASEVAEVVVVEWQSGLGDVCDEAELVVALVGE